MWGQAPGSPGLDQGGLQARPRHLCCWDHLPMGGLHLTHLRAIHLRLVFCFKELPQQTQPLSQPEIPQLPAATSWLMGTEPNHSRFSCLVRRPEHRERGQLSRSGAWADVLMKNLQGIIRGFCSSPCGQNPPRLVAQAPARILENAPIVLKKIWLREANAWCLMHWAVLPRLGCKCSSGEIDEVSVNLRLTV